MAGQVSKRLMFLSIIALVLTAILVLAWYDGGRQEQRLIEQPANVPEEFS